MINEMDIIPVSKGLQSSLRTRQTISYNRYGKGPR